MLSGQSVTVIYNGQPLGSGFGSVGRCYNPAGKGDGSIKCSKMSC